MAKGCINERLKPLEILQVGRVVAGLSWVAAALIAIFALTVFPLQAHAGGDPVYETIDELKDQRIGVPSGTVTDQYLEDLWGKDVDLSYFNSETDGIAAVRSGKVEAYASDKMRVLMSVNQFADLAYIPENICEDEYGFAFAKGSTLTPLFNEQIHRMEADGTLAALEDKWMGADDSAKVAPVQDWDAPNGTLKVGIAAVYEPSSYIVDGEVAGFDPDLMTMIAKELGYHIQFDRYSDVGSTIAALQSGKVDMVGGSVSITEERGKLVDFTGKYYDSSVLLMVKSTDSVQAGGIIDQLASGFSRSLVHEHRWRLVLAGLGVTIVISLLSGVFGLLLGYGLCQMRRSGHRAASSIATVIIRIVQGVPALVLLMILFYVVFGKVDLPGIAVAVIAFAINFGVYSAEIMRAGIEGIDKGQTEAAIALGYTPRQAFWKVVFPQAARQFMPVLRGEFISMVKMTSVVGYVAVEDLTRVSDIIRSRTLDAFFPLLLTAILYFAIANILAYLLTLVDKHLDARKSPVAIKGVVLR